MKIPGIYQIQSQVKPERIYIGSAVNIQRRWLKHLSDLNKNKYHCAKLQNHVNKYGVNDLSFKIITECCIEKLRIKEQCYINIYQPYFNVSMFVCNLTELCRNKRTENHKNKISLAQTGENNSFFGKHHSEESKQKKREWNLLHGIKPPVCHLGRKKGSKNKKKIIA